MTEISTLTDKQMFHEIMEELRHLRRRIDKHIDDEGKTLNQVHRDISAIKEDVAGHKTKLAVNASKLAMLSAGVAIVVTAFIGWLSDQIGFTK